MSFNGLPGLLKSMEKHGITCKYLSDAKDVIFVSSQNFNMSMTCQEDAGCLVFYFYDRTLNASYFGGKIKSIKGMMKKFDRFILWHHKQDLANNPFFEIVTR